MASFIKVTQLTTGKGILINLDNVTDIVPLDQSFGSRLSFNYTIYNVVSRIDVSEDIDTLLGRQILGDI
jgi:hypothetical protein